MSEKKNERIRILTAVFITLTVIACVLQALGSYLLIDGILRGGVLEALTDNGASGQRAVGRALFIFSFGVLGLAMVLGIVRAVLLHGWFSPFSETPEEKAAEASFALMSFVLGLGILFGPDNSFLDRWAFTLIAALIFLFVGARLWVKPEEREWGNRELLGYATLIALAIVNLLLQILRWQFV